jgi:uncharacterized protein (UPF0297 family)
MRAREFTQRLSQGVAEGSGNNNVIAQKIFFARSKIAPKAWSYDHVGFITQDGKQIQMSGHKGNDVYITNDVTDDPEFPEQQIKVVSLPKPVNVPTTNSVGAENCGTFVANVLRANGFKGFDTEKLYRVFKKPKKQGVAEGAMKDLDHDIQDQQWDAIVGYVVNGVKKGMDTDRMELTLYKWASRELVDVEQALEDHGFRDIADLVDHIEQHDGRYVPPSDFGLGNLGRRVAEHNLQELGTSVYKVSEPKNNTEYNNNQVVSKNYKFRVGGNLFLVTFLVTDRKVEGSSSVLRSLEANFGIYDPSGYEYDNIQYDITDKHKNQFKIYSTVLTVLQNFMTKYGKDINQIRFPGYSPRQDEMYEKFFKSRYLEKYLPGFSYDPKSRTLIRNGIKLEPEQIEVKAKKQRK